MIGVGKNKPYLNISDIIDVEKYEKLDSRIINDIIYCLNNDELFKENLDAVYIEEKLTLDNLYQLSPCGSLEVAGGIEGCPKWMRGILGRLDYLFDFWNDYFEINDLFYSSFHFRFDFSTLLKNQRIGDLDAGSIDDDELHKNIMKDFHNNESCIRIWTTPSKEKGGIYLYDWEERILHKTNGNAIIFTPSDYHGSLENSTGISIMLDPLIHKEPLKCKNQQLNDYLNSAQEWRNKREVEYSNMGIDIKDAWGVHNETN